MITKIISFSHCLQFWENEFFLNLQGLIRMFRWRVVSSREWCRRCPRVAWFSAINASYFGNLGSRKSFDRRATKKFCLKRKHNVNSCISSHYIYGPTLDIIIVTMKEFTCNDEILGPILGGFALNCDGLKNKW